MNEFNIDRAAVDPKTCKHERVIPAQCADCQREVRRPEPKKASLENISASYNGGQFCVTIGFGNGYATRLDDAINAALKSWERLQVNS